MTSNSISDWDRALTMSAMELRGNIQSAGDGGLHAASPEVVAELAALLCAYSLPAEHGEPDHRHLEGL